MQTQGYSIWLLLPAELKRKFSSIIEQLHVRYGGPLFEPHITLLGSLSLSKESMIEKTKLLCQGLSSFQLQLQGISSSSSFFQCLFIQVEKTPELICLHQKIKAELDPSRTRPYHPHLSLLYGNHPISVQQQILHTLPDWSGTWIPIDSIAIVSTEGAPDRWHYEQIISLDLKQ